MLRLKVHAIDPRNRANGPGMRYTIWLQGCSIGCDSCFNSLTHDPDLGYWLSIDELLADITKNKQQIEGISISGGEPLDQADSLLAFLKLYEPSAIGSVLLFSGYPYREIISNPHHSAVLPYLDVLISGPFRRQMLVPGRIPASTNQEIILLSDVYNKEEIQMVPTSQINITAEGEIHISGIDPLVL